MLALSRMECAENANMQGERRIELKKGKFPWLCKNNCGNFHPKCDARIGN